MIVIVKQEEEKIESENDAKLKELVTTLPRGTDLTPHILDCTAIQNRWRNLIIRIISTCFIIAGVSLFIYGGPLILILMTFIVQVKCINEIMNNGTVHRFHDLPCNIAFNIYLISCYFFFITIYTIYGWDLTDYIIEEFDQVGYVYSIFIIHLVISICFYILGCIWFVLSLSKKYHIKQIALCGWTYIAITISVVPTYGIIYSIMNGLIWFIVPFSIILINDEVTCLFNVLIQFPKHNWRGYIVGGISSIIFGLMISHVLCQYPYLVCPIESSDALLGTNIDCVPSSLFQPQEYTLPSSLQVQFNGKFTLTLSFFDLLSLLFSILSCIIVQLRGYLAIFKRKLNIKNFGNTIPGHGGIIDMFINQYVMATCISCFLHAINRKEGVTIEGITIESVTEGITIEGV